MSGAARNKQSTNMIFVPYRVEELLIPFFQKLYIYTLLCDFTEQNIPLPEHDKLHMKDLKFHP